MISEYDQMSESETIRSALHGDSKAFERLYKMHVGRAYRLCLRMIGNPSDAEDLVREAFLRVFHKLHTFRGESSFSTWLHRLTVNVVLMRIRKRKRYSEMSLDATLEDNENSRRLIEVGRQDLRVEGVMEHVNLNQAIDRLPDGYKEKFVLHDVEGYKHKEMAAILGCSIRELQGSVVQGAAPTS